MTPLAIDTADPALIKQFIADMGISSKQSTYSSFWRSSKDIENMLAYTRKNKDTDIIIFLNIERLHFKTTPAETFNPARFEDVSTTVYPTVVPVSPSPGTCTNAALGATVTPQDIYALITAIGIAIATHANTFQNVASTVIAVAAATAAAIAATTGTTTGVASLNFSTVNLPLDVCIRYLNRKEKNYLMTRTKMASFDTQIPNLTANPSGNTMRTVEFYLDPAGIGHRIFTRDSTCFQLIDPCTPATGKAFIHRTPACKGTTPMDIRKC